MEVRRCGVHGLVLGDDNKCVICRRGDVEITPRTSSDWPIVAFVCVTGLMMTGVVGYWLWRQSQPPPVSATALPPPPPPAEPTEEAEVVETAPRPSRTERPVPITTMSPAGVETEELTNDEIEAKKRRVPITMYMTPKCSLCNSARTFLKARGYALREFDVEASATDRVILESVNPSGSVPTFDVDGRVLVGYDAAVLDQAIEAKALKKAR